MGKLLETSFPSPLQELFRADFRLFKEKIKKFSKRT
jgi:hypothetical protein